eukprot:CAMPEP_0182416142 /NCGR_PEP_ID=MMETSP1167-20130531/290_1 /TAXON_ID=2988 /ORGANISM="Mallomonas Sp, Strain CCMP3275" /LENGTH=478 /DNA_ID=CAMNT_0024588623 /DNA_START=87 /DNA_END=1523 /DNA_ORIENTATION=+
MKFLPFCLLLLSAVWSAIDEDEGVLVLDDENFDEGIEGNNLLLVEFYAPWCGHCKSLAPEWAKAARILESRESPAKLAKVDATVATKTAAKFEVRGFPTIKFFKNGSPSEYGGGRTTVDIVSWLDKKTGPPAKTLESVSDLTKFQESNEVFALGVFFSTESEAAKKFLELGANDDDLPYAITTSVDIQKKLAVKGDAVVILKEFDEKRADLDITASTELSAMKAFIADKSAPLIHHFTTESSKKIFSSEIKKHVLFFTDPASVSHESTIATFAEVSASYKGKMLFVNVPATESRVMEFFGFTKDVLPKMVVADMSGAGNMKKYMYSEKMEAASISAFVASFLEGKLTPDLKSEAESPEDTTGDVVIVKGTSFKSLVMDNDKDVLIEFYAPWCGHCKQLAPKWEELGRKMKPYKSVVIAKMDSTANEIDVPGVAVQGYPTLMFFKGNDKANPKKYEGGREVDDMISFLEENAATPITVE